MIDTLRNNVLTAKIAASLKGTTVGPNSAVMRAYVNALPELTSILLQVAVGLMLGDIYLQPNASGTAHRMRFEWGNINKDYAFHVFQLFMVYCLTDPRLQTRVNHLGNSVITWPFQTVFSSVFNPLATIFLDELGKKCINIELLMPVFTPVSLAYWFMDDGNTSYDRYGISINTQGFAVQQVEMLCTMLGQLYSLHCWVKLEKGKPVLVISGHSYDTFFKLVSPHIVPSMRRKFPQLSRTQWAD